MARAVFGAGCAALGAGMSPADWLDLVLVFAILVFIGYIWSEVRK